MRRTITIALTLALGMLAAGTASAQDNAVHFKLGGFFPSGGGSFWSGTEETFTIEAEDLADPIVGFTYVHGFGNYLETGFNIDFFDATAVSGYRDFVDADGFAILHDTSLQMVPMSVDLRWLPAGRYGLRGDRRVKRPVFYLGAGIGVNFFEYEEIGDFIDFGDPDLPVVFDRFTDRGASFQTHALTGVVLPFGDRWSLMFEGKYTWSEENLGSDFAGLGKLDMGGLSISAGAALRF